MTNQIGEKVAQVADLEYKEMRALLKTIVEDDHCLIHKLEIRHKAASNNYRVIVRVSREEDVDK
jgi:hypothetical protein